MLRDGPSYIYDIFNWVDIFSYLINFYLVFYVVRGQDGDSHTWGSRSGAVYGLRAVAATGVILMWCRALYWLRIFTGTSFYVRLIRDTLYDTRYFLILYLLSLCSFANALVVLNVGRADPLY